MAAISELPDIDAALARLEAAEAEQVSPRPEAQVQTESEVQQSAPKAEATADQKTPEVNSTDTPAATDKKNDAPETTPKSEKTDAKTPDAPTTPDNRSPFAKNAERLDKTWKAVNERKTQLETREQQLTAREQAIQRREQEITAKAAKAERKFTPEQYEQAAQNKLNAIGNLDVQADGWDKRAAELEAGGKYADADRAREQAKALREQASAARVTAGQMKAYANHLRQNPDPTAQQIQAKQEQAKQFYTVEAAKAWPELAKSGSQFQKDVTAQLQEAAKNGLDANEHPVLIYHAANLVAHKAAAARVPGLEKTIEGLKAKVGELEKLTTPGGGTEANLQPARTASNEDDEAALRSAALAMS
jgi:hypothetical protein